MGKRGGACGGRYLSVHWPPVKLHRGPAGRGMHEGVRSRCKKNACQSAGPRGGFAGGLHGGAAHGTGAGIQGRGADQYIVHCSSRDQGSSPAVKNGRKAFHHKEISSKPYESIGMLKKGHELIPRDAGERTQSCTQS